MQRSWQQIPAFRFAGRFVCAFPLAAVGFLGLLAAFGLEGARAAPLLDLPLTGDLHNPEKT